MNALARLTRSGTRWTGDLVLMDKVIDIAVDVAPSATGVRAVNDRASRRIGSAVEIDPSRLIIFLDPVDGSTDSIALEAVRSDDDEFLTITFRVPHSG